MTTWREMVEIFVENYPGDFLIDPADVADVPVTRSNMVQILGEIQQLREEIAKRSSPEQLHLDRTKGEVTWMDRRGVLQVRRPNWTDEQWRLAEDLVAPEVRRTSIPITLRLYTWEGTFEELCAVVEA